MSTLKKLLDLDDEDPTGEKRWERQPRRTDISEVELSKKITRVLKTTNPRAPTNVSRFNHQEGAYKPVGPGEQMIVHLELPSTLVPKVVSHDGQEGDDAQYANASTTTDDGGAQAVATAEAAVGPDGGEAVTETAGEPAHDNETETMRSTESEESEDRKPESPAVDFTPLGFGILERETQTYHTYCVDRSIMTKPAARINFTGQVNQWQIHDRCHEELDRKKVTTKKSVENLIAFAGLGEEPGFGAPEKPIISDYKFDDGVEKEPEELPILNSLRILERMISQSSGYDLAMDFKYYDCPLDEKRKTGTLMPLWKFKYAPAAGLSISCLALCPRYPDLFIAAYGSVDMETLPGRERPHDDPPGYVCLYSIKNTSYPEYAYPMSASVCTVDSHPVESHYIAVGMMDGRVAIIDTRRHVKKEPLLVTSSVQARHKDQVWQVKWQPNDVDQRPNFFSISADGYMARWTLHKDTLLKANIMCVQTLDQALTMPLVPGPFREPNPQLNLGRGSCFDFVDSGLERCYLIGTEDGAVHRCTTIYNNKYLYSFSASKHAIYGVQWNPFMPNIFATCGLDCSVRMWDDKQLMKDSKDATPLSKFEVDDAVSAFCWAPYSSTVFAIATMDGNVRVYDVSIEKYGPLCLQRVVKTGIRLTRMMFSATDLKLLLVGDDNGCLQTMKLSPNLRTALDDPMYSERNEVLKLQEVIDWTWSLGADVDSFDEDEDGESGESVEGGDGDDDGDDAVAAAASKD